MGRLTRWLYVPSRFSAADSTPPASGGPASEWRWPFFRDNHPMAPAPLRRAFCRSQRYRVTLSTSTPPLPQFHQRSLDHLALALACGSPDPLQRGGSLRRDHHLQPGEQVSVWIAQRPLAVLLLSLCIAQCHVIVPMRYSVTGGCSVIA
jgi:hypothetical protein